MGAVRAPMSYAVVVVGVGVGVGDGVGVAAVDDVAFPLLLPLLLSMLM